MEESLAFTFPFGRQLGLVLSAEAVAVAALEGLMRGDAEIVPGFLNRAYTKLAALSPTSLAAKFAALFFDPRANPLASGPALLRSLPVLIPGSLLLVLCALVEALEEVACTAAACLTSSWLGLLLASLGLLSVANACQNGLRPSQSSHPRISCLADVRALRRKSEFVSAWRAAPPPSTYAGRCFDGEIVGLGVTAPLSSFITHVLFGGGRRWLGKAFADERSGVNRFDGQKRARRFGTEIAISRLDGKLALVLDYSAPHSGDSLWGGVVGMRDELREVAPGLLLGLGSMAATGGALNCAPFVLVERREQLPASQAQS